MATPAYGSLPFAEQIAFFRQKVNLPTARWDDLLGAAHDRAFVVAGAAKADLLADLRTAVTKAIAQGTTLATFRQDFDALVARHGWTGWTGEGTAAGRAWRTRIIYETNLRASYAAGRWAQIQQVKAERPYLLYRHNDNVLHPRPLHVAWDGKVIAAADPWWRTHFPPNGWGCQCRVHAVDDAYLRKIGKAGPDPAPDDGTYDDVNKTSGVTRRDIPKGIDPGWDYAPGASVAAEIQALLDQKMRVLEAQIGADLWASVRDTAPVEGLMLALANMVDRVSLQKTATGESLLIHAVAPATVADLSENHKIELASAGIWLKDHDLLHAIRDTKETSGKALSATVWRDLPTLLAAATPYLDLLDQALVYAFDLEDGTGKVVIRVNYSEKIRQDGKRARITANFIRTGGMVEKHNLEEGRYAKLER